MSNISVQMDIPPHTSAMRLVREKKSTIEDLKYRVSYRVLEGTTDQVLCDCDVYGDPLFATVEYREGSSIYVQSPNRSWMPSRWCLRDVHGQVCFEVKRASLFWFLNPFARRTFYVLNNLQRRHWSLRRSNKGWLAWLSGPASSAWTLVDGDNIQAILERVSVKSPERPKDDKGLFAKLRGLLRESQWVLMTPGSQHLIPASVFICLMQVIEGHQDNSI